MFVCGTISSYVTVADVNVSGFCWKFKELCWWCWLGKIILTADKLVRWGNRDTKTQDKWDLCWSLLLYYCTITTSAQMAANIAPLNMADNSLQTAVHVPCGIFVFVSSFISFSVTVCHICGSKTNINHVKMLVFVVYLTFNRSPLESWFSSIYQ